MGSDKKITYLVSLSMTNGKLDPMKIAAIAKKLKQKELLSYLSRLKQVRENEKVTILTAIDMPTELAKKFEKIFQKKDLIFAKDPSVLAGMKVKFSDFVFDASFKTYLQKLRSDNNEVN